MAIAEGSGGDADLAQELTNPIANLVTIPIQMNFDNNIGLADEGTKITTNVQPVIPFEVNDDWSLITRTIMPIIHQTEKTEQWSVPVNVSASKLVRFGKLPVSLQAGVGYWAESPDAGPEGVRFRLQANIVLPR